MANKKQPRRRKLKREDKKLAKRIREVRKERGLSQEELSLRLGHNVSYIAYVETNRSGVSLPTLYKIAKILKVKVRDLFTF
ncbi:MAG TPA: helix-turn-helix transcriptional regulator [Candidatus Bathyarchaeia archaeon]|nr:helix-turn-helix transcriptional regulator [Candidatus Bathyarchaeia archaeon]